MAHTIWDPNNDLWGLSVEWVNTNRHPRGPNWKFKSSSYRDHYWHLLWHDSGLCFELVNHCKTVLLVNLREKHQLVDILFSYIQLYSAIFIYTLCPYPIFSVLYSRTHLHTSPHAYGFDCFTIFSPAFWLNNHIQSHPPGAILCLHHIRPVPGFALLARCRNMLWFQGGIPFLPSKKMAF